MSLELFANNLQPRKLSFSNNLVIFMLNYRSTVREPARWVLIATPIYQAL